MKHNVYVKIVSGLQFASWQCLYAFLTDGIQTVKLADFCGCSLLIRSLMK